VDFFSSERKNVDFVISNESVSPVNHTSSFFVFPAFLSIFTLEYTQLQLFC